MILADAINFPLLVVYGLIAFGPLTLLVTIIESFVFRLYLKTGLRIVFMRVLVANIISTFAGSLILMFQDMIVIAANIHDSIPAFVRGYQWVGPLLIAIYFAKSVIVEGFWLTRRRFLERLERRAGSVLIAVFIGNVFSYLIVGPLFYFTTRPHFGGVETTFDSSWTANPEQVVYYIDRDNKYVKGARLDGSDAKTLIPFRAQSFLVSADETTFAYLSDKGSLFVYRIGDKEPILVCNSGEYRFMTTVSLSPDNRRVAYLEPPVANWGYHEGVKQYIMVFDLYTRDVVVIGTVPANDWGSPVAWSADGKRIYSLEIVHRSDVLRGQDESEQWIIHVFNPDSPFGLQEKLTDPPPLSDLVVNYVRAQGSAGYSGGQAMIRLPNRFQMNEYQVDVWPYLGSGVSVSRGNKQVLLLQNEYGLLDLSLPPVECAVALPSGDELLVEWWNQLYVLNLEKRRLGLVANGDQFVLRSPKFRVTFDSKARP